MSAQETVVNATRARGYWAGYSPYQMLARNLVKMAEELGEASEGMFLDAPGADGEFDGGLALLREEARQRFDDRAPDRWYSLLVADGTMAKELADMQIVLMNAAQAFAELTGEPFDVVAEAIKKSRADVSRGVRGAE